MKDIKLKINKIKWISLSILLLLIISLPLSILYYNDNSSAKFDSSDSFDTNSLYPVLHPDVQVRFPNYEKNPLLLEYAKKNYSEVISKASEKQNQLSNLYILAMSYYKLKQYHEAIPFFQKALAKESYIKDWLYFHLGDAYFKTGQYQKCTNVSKNLRLISPNYPELQKALEIEANSYINTKQYDKLISEFTQVDTSKSLKVKEAVYYYIGQGYENLNQKKEAMIYYRKAIGLATDKYTKQALLSLQQLDSSYLNAFSEPQLIHTAQYIYKRKSKSKKKDYRNVILLLKNVYTQKNDYFEFKRLSLLANAHRKLEKKEKAYIYYNKILKHFNSNSKYYKEGQALLADFMITYDSVKAYFNFQELLKEDNHPFMYEICRSMSYVLDYDEQDVMIAFIKRAIESKEYRLVDRIMFTMLNKKQYLKMVQLFSKVTQLKFDNKYKTKIYYWLGKASFEGNDKELAIRNFVDGFLNYKGDFYTYKCEEQLKLHLRNEPKTLEAVYEKDVKNQNAFVKSDNFVEKLIPIKTRIDLNRIDDRNFKRAFQFFTLGENKEGYNFFLKFLKSIHSQRAYYSLVFSRMFHDLGLNEYAVRYSDFLIAYFNRKNDRNYMLSELKETSYPFYYRELIFSKANEHGVDPYLVMAVIREESRFNPAATSRSGAMGLMQLLPTTASYLSGSKEKLNYYNEELNVDLGVKYIAKLLKDNSKMIAVASYNGGPGRIGRLFKKAKLKKDLLNTEHFIELMEIDETRNYVKKVLSSYYNYKELYH